MGPGTRAGVPSRLGQDGRGEHKRSGAESDGEMALGPRLASRRGGNAGRGGPTEGRPLHAQGRAARLEPPHPAPSGDGCGLDAGGGPLGGFDMVTGHLSMEPSHKDRHEADTAAWPSLDAPCLHALTFCRHRGPSPAGPSTAPWRSSPPRSQAASVWPLPSWPEPDWVGAQGPAPSGSPGPLTLRLALWGNSGSWD